MLACVNNKMKVRMNVDYKSIALPAELQGLRVFCRINSLISQLNQYKIKSISCSLLLQLAGLIAKCRAFVTHLSVFESVWDFTILFSLGFHNIIQFHYNNKNMEWNNYESDQIFKS